MKVVKVGRTHPGIVDEVFGDFFLVQPAVVAVVEVLGQVPVVECLCDLGVLAIESQS